MAVEIFTHNVVIYHRCICVHGFFEDDASIFVVISYAYQAKKEIVNLLAEVKSLIVVS